MRNLIIGLTMSIMGISSAFALDTHTPNVQVSGTDRAWEVSVDADSVNGTWTYFTVITDNLGREVARRQFTEGSRGGGSAQEAASVATRDFTAVNGNTAPTHIVYDGQSYNTTSGKYAGYIAFNNGPNTYQGRATQFDGDEWYFTDSLTVDATQYTIQLGTNGVRTANFINPVSREFDMRYGLEQVVTQVWDVAYEAGYQAGYDDGYHDGYTQGYSDGFADGVASVN